MSRRAILLLLSLLTLPAWAQEVPLHRLRVLALGDPPPFVQEIRNGVRYEVPPPAGTIPPREVTVAAPVKPDGKKESAPVTLRLRLGQPTPAITVPLPEDRRIQLVGDQGAKWLAVPLQAGEASLALVWRGGPTWKDARTIVVPDGADARAEGNVNFANLTATPMALSIGTDKIRLNPGKTFTRKLEGPAVTVEIFHPTPTGELQLCHSASLEAGRGSYRRILIYAADGENPRRPVKVLQLEEPSASPVPAKVAAAS